MKTIKMNAKGQTGFTLIEIAIVLVIIGLLLGGVLQGQQLIENSKVRSATNTINGLAAASHSYLDSYGRLPGDDGDTAKLQARGGNWINVTSDAVTGLNGSIDVLSASETFQGAGEEDLFFAHLRAGGFISGDPDLTGIPALPQNPFGGLVGLTSDPIVGTPGLAGTKVCLGNVPGSAGIAMDNQLDDGNGATGNLRAVLSIGSNTPPSSDPLANPYSEDQLYTVCFRI